MAKSSAVSNRLDVVQLARLVIRLARAFDQRLHSREGCDGLGLADVGVLAEIERGTALPSAIARAARLDPARVTRIVDRLVQLGLVQRGANEQDRRQSPLSLTPTGLARLEAARADVRQVMDGALDGLTAEQQAILAAALDGVEAALLRLR